MDNDKELKDGAASDFQFVTITKPGHGWKDKNEHIVRSHVMRLVRQKQREKRSPKPRGSQGRHVNGLGERYGRFDILAYGTVSIGIYLQQLAPIALQLTTPGRPGK
jgi:hypothetical protein